MLHRRTVLVMETFLFPLFAAVVLALLTVVALVPALKGTRPGATRVGLALAVLTLVAVLAALVIYAVTGVEVTITRS